MNKLSPEELALFNDPPVAKPEPAANDAWEDDWSDESTANSAYVVCQVCGMQMIALGKMPHGHEIDPSLCPNVASHAAALESKAKVIPPDAPKNDANFPPPEKAKRGRGRPPKEKPANAAPITIEAPAGTAQAVPPGTFKRPPDFRDELAMAALSGLLAAADWSDDVVAQRAYSIADAMIKFRV